MRRNASTSTVVGIDVGGPKKGFHAVALRDGRYFARLHTPVPAALVKWCRSIGALAVGIDAPCRWSLTGRARACERALSVAGFTTFATPSLAVAKSHPFYGWMINGASLFRLLAPYYRLFDGGPSPARPVCFETFPQAVACALAGKMLSAKHKRIDRPQLNRRAGISMPAPGNIDEADAALCALAAQYFLNRDFTPYGDADEGFIIVPNESLRPRSDRRAERRIRGGSASVRSVTHRLETGGP